MIFVFVSLLPLITVIQLVMAAISVKADFGVSCLIPQKRTPVIINAVIRNKCILPMPFAEAILILPDKYGEKCEETRFIFTLLPFSSRQIERSIEFAFRGEWNIGIKCIYVYDFFRAVRIRLPVNCSADVFVMPRNLTLDSSRRPHTDSGLSGETRHFSGSDNTEPEDIRPYTPGDSKKAIHWKLSTKSEDIIVKQYADDTSCVSVVLCDLQPLTHRSDSVPHRKLLPEYAETADLYCTDLAIELTLSAVRRELANNRAVTLAWFESGMSTFISIKDEADFDENFRRIACARADITPNQLTQLAESFMGDSPAAVTIITSAVDKITVDTCIGIADKAHTIPTEVLISAADCMFSPEGADSKTADYIGALEAIGVSVTTTESN